jgi:MoxR-like ATPase
VLNGVVRCRAFPLVIMTSNGERDFPPPFLRRCLRFRMPNPSPTELQGIVEKHLGNDVATQSKALIDWFCEQIEAGETLATDQLLNAIHIRTQEKVRPNQPIQTNDESLTLTALEKRLLKDLSSPEEV